MKKILTTVVALSFFLTPFAASALVQVDGYYRSDGTYVEPHYRSAPDSIESNNLGSDGIDVDGDGYGAGDTNPRYRSQIDSSSLYDSYRDTYNSSYDYGSSYDSGYDSYDSGLNSYDYGSSYDSYDSSYDSYGSSYDSYDYGLDSYNYNSSYDSHGSGYDSSYNSLDSGYDDNEYYINTDDNRVQSPSYSNSGSATARCEDGTYSYSQSRSGTCSHHGGVSTWY